MPYYREMKIRIFSIGSIGITMGFLLGMAVIGMLRALIDDKTPRLELAFASLVTGWKDG